MTRTCSDCPSPISRFSKGRCKPCSARRLNADPAISAKRKVAQEEFFGRPEVKKDLAERIQRTAAKLTPDQIEARRARGRHVAATVLHRPDVAARSNSPEAKARAGRARTNTVLAWCPPEYRARYRALKDSQLIRAPEARRMIEEEIARDERQRLAAMTPFERQLEWVRNGGALVAKPDLRKADHSFTLGGVASGML